jgi:predicted HicB family RNase H-like nuclease
MNIMTVEKSLQIFLEVCKEKGIEPRRHFSGKFNLRIPLGALGRSTS